MSRCCLLFYLCNVKKWDLSYTPLRLSLPFKSRCCLLFYQWEVQKRRLILHSSSTLFGVYVQMLSSLLSARVYLSNLSCRMPGKARLKRTRVKYFPVFCLEYLLQKKQAIFCIFYPVAFLQIANWAWNSSPAKCALLLNRSPAKIPISHTRIQSALSKFVLPLHYWV